jgi:hypothetical protein
VVKVRALTETPADKIQSRNIAIGRLMLSAHTLEVAISRLDETVHQLMNQEPRDIRKILHVMRVLKALNHQLLECAKAQLLASSEPPSGTTGIDLQNANVGER